jgi:hypothetical protein
MQLITLKIEKPEDTNFILGQTHFIKSVEDIHEALVNAVPGIQFGVAFAKPQANAWCDGLAPIEQWWNLHRKMPRPSPQAIASSFSWATASIR